jgi:hypothetical protein
MSCWRLRPKSRRRGEFHGHLDYPVIGGIQPMVSADVVGDLAEVF